MTVEDIINSGASRIRVIAGPGTGKTKAMRGRVNRLLSEGVDPAEILPVTFTRLAAIDMQQALTKEDSPLNKEINAMTLHRLALAILMRRHGLGGLGRTPRPLNDFERDPLYADMKKLGYNKKVVKEAIKNYQYDRCNLKGSNKPGVLEGIISWLKFHEAMLIGEVIPYLHDYLNSSTDVEERRKYAHILVDEYQDFNHAEQKVIGLLSDKAKVCIFGDDDQSIYGFRNAEPEGIRKWGDENPDERDDFPLEECARCPKLVVSMANNLIGHNTDREPKCLVARPSHPDGDISIIKYANFESEVKGVAELVRHKIASGVPPADIFVLAQYKVFANPIYEELKSMGIPVKSYHAESELDTHAAKRALALLKLVTNHDDRVALRWLIGEGHSSWHAANYAHIRKHCEEEDMSPWDVMMLLKSGELSLGHKHFMPSLINSFRDLVQELESLEGLTNRELVEKLLPEGEESIKLMRDLADKVLNELSDTNDRQKFVSELSAATSMKEADDKVDYVQIMSLLKSKGLSAPVTIVVGCVKGVHPRQAKAEMIEEEKQCYLEEQRRLFYVAITRVKTDPEKNKKGTLIFTFSEKMSWHMLKKFTVNASDLLNRAGKISQSQFIDELGSSRPDITQG